MALTKVAPAGIGSTPGDGYRIGSSFLHSTGVELTNANASGIVTAAQFDGKLNIGIATFTDDVKFTGATSGRDVLWDKSENSLEFGDYTYAKFGADTDLTIWSNDTLSAINNKTGELRILSADDVKILKRNNDGAGHLGQVANFNIGGAVELFYNATKRIETSGIGATVTGQLDVGNVNSTGVITATKFVGDIAVGSSITYADNEKAYFGTDLDASIKHTGTNLQIFETTGNIQITNYANDKDVVISSDDGSGGTANYFLADGSTGESIFYNYGNEKLKTTSSGVTVTGGITASGASTFNEDVTFTGATSGRDITWDKSNDYLMVKDNSRIVFGNGGDLSIRHLSSDNTSYVSSTTNNVTHEFNKTKTWTLTTTAAEKRIHCPADSTSTAVELYHNGSKKLETSSSGLQVTGNISGSGTIRINSGSTSGALNLDGGATNHGGEINLLGGSNGGRILFRTGQGSGQQSERMRLNENGSLRIGDAATHTFSAHSEGDDLVVGGAGWRGMTIYGEGGGGVIQFADNGDNRIGQILYNHNDNSMSFRTAGNVTRFKIGADGSSYNTSNSSGTTSHEFYNSNSGSGADTRVLIKTYANQGADPFIKFDSGGSNMVVGQLWAGTNNNKLVLGVGESPSGGVSGIHIPGNGDTHITNHLYMAKSSDPRIYAGSSVGLNIDGQALYLNRYVNSTIAMGNGGGPVTVSNTTSGNSSVLNIYKSTGDNSDLAVLRVGYDANACYQISRQRNSASIVLNQTQGGGIAHHQNTGDDTMLLTSRNSVHIAKLAPMVIQHAHVQSNATWGGSRPIKFVMRFSTGNFSANYHVARMISQHDWGFTDWEATVYHDYYSPSANSGSTHRYTGYYSSHTDQVKDYNQNSSGSGTGDSYYLSKNSNLGPGGAHKIHESSNGGYYRDAYATDYYLSLGNYSGATIEIKINNSGGFLKDQATTLSTIYPAAFNGQASQSDANSWSYGRGLWFNVRTGILDNSWWGHSSNFGQLDLPNS